MRKIGKYQTFLLPEMYKSCRCTCLCLQLDRSRIYYVVTLFFHGSRKNLNIRNMWFDRLRGLICWWRNRFNVTGQFTEKKLAKDKSSPLAHKKFTGTAYERCLKVLTYMCGWCSGEFCPTELPYKNCLFLYVQEISTQLTFKLWCVSYREIVGLGMNSLI